MSIGRKTTFFLGIFIVLIPFLGIPTLWKMGFTVFGGVFLMLASLKWSMSKRSFKPKFRKEKVEPLVVDRAPVYPHNDTIEAVSVVVPPTIQTVYEAPVAPAPKPAPRKRRTTKPKATVAK